MPRSDHLNIKFESLFIALLQTVLCMFVLYTSKNKTRFASNTTSPSLKNINSIENVFTVPLEMHDIAKNLFTKFFEWQRSSKLPFLRKNVLLFPCEVQTRDVKGIIPVENYCYRISSHVVSCEYIFIVFYIRKWYWVWILYLKYYLIDRYKHFNMKMI